MRIVSVTPPPARPRSSAAGENDVSPETIVCGALALALLFLMWRIAGVLGFVEASWPL